MEEENKVVAEQAPEYEPPFKMGKKPHYKHAAGNPKSKNYNPKVGANRRKEKARRKTNAKLRRARGK